MTGDRPEAALSSRIIKGGALVSDARSLVEHWDPALSAPANLARIEASNLLGKRSASRSSDVVYKVLRPRFVDPGPQVIPAMRALLSRNQAFVEACTYESARADPLLARFLGEALAGWWHEGRSGISVDVVSTWLGSLISSGDIVPWAPSLQTRVAHGLLATARDFGLLEGAMLKRLSPVNLSLAGFSYVAYRLAEEGANGRRLLATPVWRWWRLDPDDVEHYLADAARSGVLSVSRAGSVVRVDWQARSLMELTGAVA